MTHTNLFNSANTTVNYTIVQGDWHWPVAVVAVALIAAACWLVWIMAGRRQ